MQDNSIWESAIYDYKYGCNNRVVATPVYYVNGIVEKEIGNFDTGDFLKYFDQYVKLNKYKSEKRK